MKTIKRWTAFLLCCALVLALAACGGGGDSQAASGSTGNSGATAGNASAGSGGKGRYMETDVTPPNATGMLHSFVDEDGTLVCYSQNLTSQFTSSDGGENWEESDGPNSASVLPGEVQTCTRLPDGSLLVAMMDESGSTTGLVRLSPDGETEPFAVPNLDEAIAKGPVTQVRKLLALSENRLLLDFFSGDFGGRAAAEEAESDSGVSEESAVTDASSGQEEPAAEAESAPAETESSAPQAESTPPDGPEDEPAEEEPRIANFVTGGEQITFTGLIDLETGEVRADFSGEYFMNGVAGTDTLHMIDYGGKISTKALADGKAQTTGEGQLALGQGDFNVQMAAGPDGLLIMDSNKIQKMDAEGNFTTVLEGSNYSFGAVGNRARALHLLPGGEMVAQLDEGGNSRLYRYHWDENAQLDEANILRVWALEENPLVRGAITAMRRENPDVSIEFEVALQQDSGLTAEDAIKNLNTRLLSGDGPDVLILDGVPVESYAARGMLQNLAGAVDTSALFPNLVAPFATDAGTFYLPTSVKIPVMLGMRENLDKASTLDGLVQMIEAGPLFPLVAQGDDVFSSLPETERPVLSPGLLQEVYDLLWESSAASVITPQGLDSAALTQMLGALVSISDKYGMGEGMGAPGGSLSMSSEDGMMAGISGAPLAYSTGRAVLGAYSVNDVQFLDMMMQPPESELVAFPGVGVGGFVPLGLVGINAGSSKTELATQFVNLMLGEEMQSLRTGAGIPVSEAGLQKQIAGIDAMMQESRSESFAFDYASLIALAQTPQMADETVNGMVWAVAQSLCKGEIDLEGAVTQLEQELGNYLAERQ